MVATVIEQTLLVSTDYGPMVLQTFFWFNVRNARGDWYQIHDASLRVLNDGPDWDLAEAPSGTPSSLFAHVKDNPTALDSVGSSSHGPISRDALTGCVLHLVCMEMSLTRRVIVAVITPNSLI